MSHQYFDVGPKIQSGDVILWDFGYLTPIIKGLTGNKFMRCGLAWKLPNGEITVLGTGIFSPFNYVKSLHKKTPFYWVATNLEITHDVRRYALSVVKERPSIKDRFKNVIRKIKDGEFNTACARFLAVILYKGKFIGVIDAAEYKISELVRLMDVRRLLMIKVSK